MTEIDLGSDEPVDGSLESASRKSWWHMRPLVVVLLVVLVVIGAGFGFRQWLHQRDLDAYLGDRGALTVEVDDTCYGLLSFETEDGLRFTTYSGARVGEPFEPADVESDPMPDEWAGQSVSGTLEIVKVNNEDDMQAVFHAADGTDVAVYGGRSWWNNLACAVRGD